jgi:hypothetical protein
MNNFYSSIYKAFIYAGMIAFIIGFFTDNKTSLGAYIAGYSVFILAIMMILIILFSNILKTDTNALSYSVLSSILMTSGPFLLILGIITFVLYLLIKYKDNITDGKVAPGYSSFSNIIVILLFLQFYLVYTNINTEKFEATGRISKVMSSIIYLIGVITAICSIILYTILKYYSTDGFSTMLTIN